MIIQPRIAPGISFLPHLTSSICQLWLIWTTPVVDRSFPLICKVLPGRRVAVFQDGETSRANSEPATVADLTHTDRLSSRDSFACCQKTGVRAVVAPNLRAAAVVREFLTLYGQANWPARGRRSRYERLSPGPESIHSHFRFSGAVRISARIVPGLDARSPNCRGERRLSARHYDAP